MVCKALERDYNYYLRTLNSNVTLNSLRTVNTTICAKQMTIWELLESISVPLPAWLKTVICNQRRRSWSWEHSTSSLGVVFLRKDQRFTLTWSFAVNFILHQFKRTLGHIQNFLQGCTKNSTRYLLCDQSFEFWEASLTNEGEAEPRLIYDP